MSVFKTIAVAWLVLGAAACAGSSAQDDPGATGGAAPAAFTLGSSGGTAASDVATAAATITAEAVAERTTFLASDELMGRDTPSPGLDRAAEYIAQQFASFGVEPAGTDGYLQRWPYPVLGLAEDQTSLVVRVGGTAHTLRYGSDFAGEPAAPGAVNGELVVSASAQEPERLAATQGKTAVLLISMPELVSQARVRARAAAARAGARSVVFVLEPGFEPARVGALARELSATRRIVGDPDGIPTAYVRHEALAPILREAGVDLDALRQQAAAGSLTPVAVSNATAAVATPARIVEDARPPNVVGIVRGSDPALRDTYVVLSAHMDHVGARSDQSGRLQIWNGADDNASGTTAVMLIARAFASLEEKPARSVIFLLVSGEEKGLLGSRWFSENPTVPADRIVANINMDMVGRNHPDSVSVLGQEYSSLGPLVHRVNEAHPELRMTVAPDLWPNERLFFRSDQLNFARLEIPNLFFFAGLHEDYHQPSDTPDKLNTDKIARVARLVFYAAHAVASDPNPPQWTPEGLAEVRRMTGGR